METDRIYLRPLKLSDNEMLYENIFKDEQNFKYTIWNSHKNENETKNFIENYLHTDDSKLWTINLFETGELVGLIKLVITQAKRPRITFTIVIGHEYQKQGYGVEAIKKILPIAFEKFHARRFEAYCDVENIGSRKMFEKANIRFEGILRNYGNIYKKESFDCALYAMTDDDYVEIKKFA